MSVLLTLLRDSLRSTRSEPKLALEEEIVRQRRAYLELLKNCLIGTIYEDPSMIDPQFRPELREKGLDWPTQAHSMIGNQRMLNLCQLCEDVILRDVPGDFIETGAWRGGSSIFMRGILKAYGVRGRTVWVADSFEGLPPPDPHAYPADRDSEFHMFVELAVPLEEVEKNFRRYGLLDEQVRFLKGWFKDTLHVAPIERLAILRLDGDMYQSTMDALRALYRKLSPAGYVIVDDFIIASCRKAVEDFREEHGIDEPMQPVDGSAVYWQKRKA